MIFTSFVHLIYFGIFYIKERDGNVAGSLYEGGQLISGMLIFDGLGDEQEPKTLQFIRFIAFLTKALKTREVVFNFKINVYVRKQHTSEKSNSNSFFINNKVIVILALLDKFCF